MQKINRPGVSFSFVLIIAAAFVAAIVSGCESQPKQGNTGGRVDPYKTTIADERSPEISTVGLLEFSDKVAESLVSRISSISEITSRPEKVVLELGALDNQTRTSTRDYNQIRRRIMSRMVNSDILRKYANVMEAPEVMDGQARRLGQEAPPDLIDEGGQADTGTARYSKDKTYLMNGYFGEQVRGGGAKSTYFLQITLTHLGSRRVVFSEDFDMAQVR